MTVLSLLEMLMSTLALRHISKYLGIYQHHINFVLGLKKKKKEKDVMKS